MKIKTVRQSISANMAKERVQVEISGKGEVLLDEPRLKYFPFWISLIFCIFDRIIFKPRKIMMGVAVEAIGGGAGMFEGQVSFIEREIDDSLIYKPKIQVQTAKNFIERFAKQSTMYKYKKVPKIDFQYIDLVYKPIWLVKYYKKIEKYMIVDAENGDINYDLTTLFRESNFEVK